MVASLFKNIGAACFLEVKALLSLSRTVARILAFKSSLYVHCLFAGLYENNFCIHLFGKVTHSFFVTTASADKKSKLCTP